MIIGLGVGIYMVIIIDVNGCQAVKFVEIGEYDGVMVVIIGMDIVCGFEIDGMFIVMFILGILLFIYVWSIGVIS